MAAELCGGLLKAPLDLLVRRDGRELNLSARQHLRKVRDETGVRVEVPELGALPDSAVFTGEPERIWVRWGVGEAAQRAVADTLGATRSMALGIYKIVTGHISSEAIGGPIMIALLALTGGWVISRRTADAARTRRRRIGPAFSS